MKNDNARFETKTNLHQQWLGQMRDFYAEHRYIPTYEYMGQHFRIGSKSLVSKLINLLKEENFLKHGPDNKLVPASRFFERRKSLSTVQAGEFTDNHVDEHDYVSIDEMVVEKPSITEMMDVEGPSMKDKHIFDGDKALIQVRKDAKVGDVVVAILESGEKTIKTLGKEGVNYVLIPANEDFETLRPKNGFEIYGVLKWTFRKHN